MKRALVISLICVLGLAFSGLAATLSGSWDTDVTIDPQQTGFNDAIALTSAITVAYMVGDWTFTSLTSLTENGWVGQTFDVAGVLGAFTLSSGLGFDPDVPEFTSWTVNAGVSIAGVSFGAALALTNPGNLTFGGPFYHIAGYLAVYPAVKVVPQPDPLAVLYDRANDLSLTLTGSGVAGDVEVDVTVTFGSPNEYTYFILTGYYGWDPVGLVWVDITVGGTIRVKVTNGVVTVETGAGTNIYAALPTTYSEYKIDIAATTYAATVTPADDWMFNEECDLDWTGVVVNVGFPFCCADIDLALEFDCDGFVSATFTTAGIAIPNIPWLTIDAELVYTIGSKTLELQPAFDFGTIVCFDLYFEVDGTNDPDAAFPISFSTISIVGIGLTCDIGAVSFSGLSYMGHDDKPGLLYGTPYWEVYSISSNDDACCGPFTFDLAFYFLDGGAKLFDIALIDADMTLQIAAQFLFNMGLEVNVETGAFTEWTVGFLVTW